jgi:hypothetical protein
MADELRNRLIERIRTTPAVLLLSLEKALDALECGGTTPLWIDDRQRSAAGAAAPVRSLSKIQSGVVPPHSKIDWPHAPLHRLSPNGTYLVTAGTLYKQHFFGDAGRLDCLHAALLELANKYHGAWRLGLSSRITIISSGMPRPMPAI